ncbi:MAG: peptide chain release factor N(5)-glutamine methyltransferase [Clostridia bacterium]|nr:peptide chain release factor N(5)-glutamine methyltransferase [Clostridia bacterium]
MTVRALYNEARRALAVVTEDPAFEALCLVEKYFGLDRSGLLLHGDRAADAETEKAFQIAVEQRLSGEPLQYLLGEWDFMALTLFCGPGVLIPRDDTAVLVEAAAERLRGAKQPRGLDLCAGTGAVALMLAYETGAKVRAVELFDGAFSYLEKNIARYPELAVSAVRGDVLSASFAETVEDGLDFIVSNPPYIETAELPGLQKEVQKEPETALDGGADGLVFYRAICETWAKKLRSGGVLAVEIGETQGEAVAALFCAAGFRDIRIHRDSGDLDRAVSGVR